MSPENLKNGDTDELEALFDQIAEQKVWESGAVDSDMDCKAKTVVASEVPQVSSKCALEIEVKSTSGDEPHDVFQRVGILTRRLHDALHELGYDKSVESAVNGLPDARARLAYIANLTGQAAEKVLAAVEVSQTLNDTIAQRAAQLDAQWDRLYSNEMSLEEFKAHAQENRAFIRDLTGQSHAIGSNLTEIMMAQDFHDLTGQVVNKIATMAQNFEQQLVQLLLDTTPSSQRKNVENTWLNGPVINADGRTDVCTNQGQVDDLLESLGF